MIEKASIVNSRPGTNLFDALQVAKSLAGTVFRSEDVRFIDILRVETADESV